MVHDEAAAASDTMRCLNNLFSRSPEQLHVL